MDLKVILTSTVIATLLTSAISFYNNFKNNRLSYITNDRKHWREEIREISADIVKADTTDIRVFLAKLKVHLNAYGNIYSNSIFKDAHIWRTIERLEMPVNKKEFNFDKSLLIDFLSLLLKYDWERSKEEITGNKRNLITIILWLAGIGFFTYLYFFDWKLSFSINFVTIITFSFVLCYSTPNYVYNNLLSEQRTSEKELTIKHVNKIIAVDFGFMLLINSAAYIPFVSKFLNSINQNMNVLITEILIIFFIFLSASRISIIEKKNAFYNSKYYFFSIKQLTEQRNEKKFRDKIILNNSSFYF